MRHKYSIKAQVHREAIHWDAGFNLEENISAWRRQMLAHGINSSATLDELESHLREDFEQQVRLGFPEQAAFATVTAQIGQADILKTEFARSREMLRERLVRYFLELAGIPIYQPVTNMNTANNNLESGWISYLKALIYGGPAVLVWVAFATMVLPELKAVCIASGIGIQEPVKFVLCLMDLVRANVLAISAIAVVTLIVLEWRSHRWPAYRRRVFGVLAYASNLFVFILITTLAVLAVAAGAQLLGAR